MTSTMHPASQHWYLVCGFSIFLQKCFSIVCARPSFCELADRVPRKSLVLLVSCSVLMLGTCSESWWQSWNTVCVIACVLHGCRNERSSYQF